MKMTNKERAIRIAMTTFWLVCPMLCVNAMTTFYGVGIRDYLVLMAIAGAVAMAGINNEYPTIEEQYGIRSA